MSAPLDLDILKMFMDECQANNFETQNPDASVEGRVRCSLLYLASAMLGGTYCDFSDSSFDAFFKETNEYLNDLTCRPLLAPWLEARNWSTEEVIALKVAHALEKT